MRQVSDGEHVERQILNSLDLIDMLFRVTASPDISSVEHVWTIGREFHRTPLADNVKDLRAPADAA